MTIFTISDTHFFHKNILRYENRPFSSIEEMNKTLIENWNNVVSKDDIVIFCGDLCFGEKENAEPIVRQLNGHKTIVLGNHDRNKKFYLDIGFQDAMKSFLFPKEVSGYNVDIIFTHHPMKGLSRDWVNIHGHIHGQTLNKEEFEIGRYFNVSVENINYTPIKLDKIIEIKGW